MTKKNSPISTTELLAKLNNDPTFVAAQRERDRVFRERIIELRVEQARLLDELRESGLDIHLVAELLTLRTSYSQAIPILLRHLLLPYSEATRETIARALAIRNDPEVLKAWPILLAEYIKTPSVPGKSSGAKMGLAVALSAVATDAVIGDVVSAAKERSNGVSRILLLSALKRSKNASAQQALIDLASDPELEKEIAAINKSKKRKTS
jgi:hypothetical protein